MNSCLVMSSFHPWSWHPPCCGGRSSHIVPRHENRVIRGVECVTGQDPADIRLPTPTNDP
ncbi:hypothetical protein DMX82_05355 [Cutibacterium acnes]|nr:hypothetical protein B1B02_04470 [Cutibacterium acnes subsp. defendens]RFS98539.1 hypothetical protein CGS52_05375 [Cutibacterium acnes]PGF31040.1 hypothetical protein B1B08_04460 [Cutibacterium acnes subsp. defendens]TMT17559.1 hypothetical protein DMX71_04450 [Cutibacterium acnes]TMT26748.1 hypothetical protein DMY02_08755 [Cutibacterium acnes]